MLLSFIRVRKMFDSSSIPVQFQYGPKFKMLSCEASQKTAKSQTFIS